MALAFWNTVDDCLVEFFELSPEQAREITRSYRSRLALLYTEKPDPYPDMIYHARPIHIAFDLMRKDVPYDREHYTRIEERNISFSRKRNAVVSQRLKSLKEELSLSPRIGSERPSVKSQLLPAAPEKQRALASS